MTAQGRVRATARTEGEARLGRAIARLLSTGVTLSAVVIAGGLLLYLVEGRSGYPHGAYPRDLVAEWRGLVAGSPYAVITAGLLALILTPVARVATSVVFFVRSRDWTYAAITGTVLVVLLATLLGGSRIP
jgi:uncharacterized membrane protein